MKMRIGIATLLVTMFFALSCAANVSYASSTLEEAVEESMYDTLRGEGIGDPLAKRISARYVFMGTVMINKMQFQDDVGEVLMEQAQATGRALGAALATSYMQYGEEALQETASVMMLSTRAGVTAEVASRMFSALAQGGYTCDASIEIVRETSEIVRSLKSNDGGEAICSLISDMARAQTSVDELRSELLSAAEREKNRQRQLIAQRESERKTKDNQGGGERAASGSRGGGNDGGSSGGGSSAGSGSDNASAAGAGRGDDSGSDSAGNGNDASSGSNDSSSGAGGNESAGSGPGAEGASDSGTDSESAGSNDSESDKGDQAIQ